MTADLMDKVNGDLQTGDFLLLVRWLGDKERVRVGPGLVAQVVPGMAEDGTAENAAWRDVLIEVSSVSYPRAVLLLHRLLPDGRRIVASAIADVREFEVVKANALFVHDVTSAPLADTKQCNCERCKTERAQKAAPNPTRWSRFVAWLTRKWNALAN